MAKTATAKAVADALAAKAAANTCLDGSPLPDPMPTRVTLTEPYGFYDDDGGMNMWSATQVVEDPDEILILMERKAPLAYELPPQPTPEEIAVAAAAAKDKPAAT
jgi:hypothetical protein